MISACRTSVDAPPLNSLKSRAIKLIRDLDISEIDKDTEYSIVGFVRNRPFLTRGSSCGS